MEERITVRMTSAMIARIDDWIARQPGYVSRQDAVRYCVDLMLGQPTPEQMSIDSSAGTAQRTSQQGLG